MLQAIAAAGYPVDDLSELARAYAPLPPRLVELLLATLAGVDDELVLEQVVRALGAPADRYDGRPLAELFDRTDSEALRWVIGNTIAEARPTEIGEWVLATLRSTELGKAREMLAVAASRICPKAEAIRALVEVLPELPGHAARGLAAIGGLEALHGLRNMPRPPHKWAQNEVVRAISAIEKRQEQGE